MRKTPGVFDRTTRRARDRSANARGTSRARADNPADPKREKREKRDRQSSASQQSPHRELAQ
jgi:hypothetical protein